MLVRECTSGALDEALEALGDLFDLEVVVYGNTRYDAREGEYRCQHGPEECYMDLFENCLIGYTKGDSRLYYPWIRCAGKLKPRGNRFKPPPLP